MRWELRKENKMRTGFGGNGNNVHESFLHIHIYLVFCNSPYYFTPVKENFAHLKLMQFFCFQLRWPLSLGYLIRCQGLKYLPHESCLSKQYLRARNFLLNVKERCSTQLDIYICFAQNHFKLLFFKKESLSFRDTYWNSYRRDDLTFGICFQVIQGRQEETRVELK